LKVKFVSSLETLLLYLIVLFPLSAVSGPLFLDLFVTIAGLIFVLIVKFDLFKNKYFKIFLLFYFLLIISSLFGKNFLHSIKTSIPYLRFFLFILAIIYISKKKNFFKLLHLSIFYLYLILVLDTYMQVFLGKTFFGLEQSNVRISGIFNDELVLGSFLVKTIPIYISLVFYNMNLFNKFFNISQFILIILSSFLIYFAGEKTSLLLSIFIIISAIVCLKKNFLKLSFFFIFLLFFFVLINIENHKNLANRYSFFKVQDNNIFFNSALIEDQLSHYKTAVLIFSDNKLTGIGPRNFRIVCKDYDQGLGCSTHPHNIYLELLAETGFIIFIAMLLIYYKFFKNYVFTIYKFITSKSIKNLEKSKFFILTSVIINFFPFIQTGSIFNNWYAALIFFSLAIYLKFFNEV
jgi:hypothetical protein